MTFAYSHRIIISQDLYDMQQLSMGYAAMAMDADEAALVLSGRTDARA